MKPEVRGALTVRGAVLGVMLILSAGCHKSKPKPPDTPPPPAVSADTKSQESPAKQNGAEGATPSGGLIHPAGGVGIVTPGVIGGGGGGAIQAVRKAARRTQARNELHNLGLLIEQMRDPFGKMPTREQILQEVQRSYPQLYQAIQEGSYILTGTTDGSGVWAYEVEADIRPGLAVIGGRVTSISPEELARYLRR
ncbi:MAG: hypothetical protein KatS3mg107_0634 [Gemmataceae bacterium]|jgi:hypothetical protein|nr:MAG: hypothetical protein KatS3mg107_0634 [Gemmataceae bacterium]